MRDAVADARAAVLGALQLVQAVEEREASLRRLLEVALKKRRIKWVSVTPIDPDGTRFLLPEDREALEDREAQASWARDSYERLLHWWSEEDREP